MIGDTTDENFLYQLCARFAHLYLGPSSHHCWLYRLGGSQLVYASLGFQFPPQFCCLPIVLFLLPALEWRLPVRRYRLFYDQIFLRVLLALILFLAARFPDLVTVEIWVQALVLDRV